MPWARSSSFWQTLVCGMTVEPPVQDGPLFACVQTKFVCRQLWRGSVRGSAAQGDGHGRPLVKRPGSLGSFAGQLLSTGEDEHSWLSMKRTAGTPLLMNDVWSLPRPGR